MKKHRPDWKPKLNIEITEDQSKQLNKLMPHGMRTKVFGAIINDLLRLCKGAGASGYIIGAILVGKIGLGYSELGEEKDAHNRGTKGNDAQ